MGLCEDADLPAYFSLVAASLGEAYTLSGRITDAISLLTQAIEQANAMEMIGFQALCRRSLGQALALAGRLEDAHVHAEGALAHAHAHQARSEEAHALRLLGDSAARYKPPESDQAEDYYRQALSLAKALGMRPLQAHCHRGLGTLYSQTGQLEQSRAELSTAIDMYRDMEMTFWLPETESALATVDGLS
jgi:tetratricopeptide (TPR) repeat protein